MPTNLRPCRRCGNLHCPRLTLCWDCYLAERGTTDGHDIIRRHQESCLVCGEMPPTLLEDEEEHENIMGTISKLSTSAYADAYGFRLPKDVERRTIQSAWQGTFSHLSFGHLTISRSRNPAIQSFALRGQILPREHLIKMHERLVVAARAKPLPLAGPAKPDYTDHPDYSLLNMIGIEFEGGWYKDRIRAHGLRIKRDSSVTVENRFSFGEEDGGAETCSDPNCDEPACMDARNGGGAAHPTEQRNRMGYQRGELEFGPWPAYDFAAAWDVSDYFNSAYPEEVDASCGQHVHVSFKSSGTYGVFVREDFRPWLINGLDRWGREAGDLPPHFEKRMLGENTYCKAIYSPEQLWSAGDRYGQVNYCHQQHGTMEVRVLPMFPNPEQSKAAIAELVRLVAIWANAFAPRPHKPILIGTAEVENNVAHGAVESPQPDWSRFDNWTPIRCPTCGHDINACRGYVRHGNWNMLRTTLRDWMGQSGTPVGCCSRARGNHSQSDIPADSQYAQILWAIHNGEITD